MNLWEFVTCFTAAESCKELWRVVEMHLSGKFFDRSSCDLSTVM